jgi:hypothetical protein
MITNGLMNPTSRVSITASQAGENSQTNGPEHTIVSSNGTSILTDLTFKKSNGKRAVSSDHALKNKLKTKRISLIHLNLSIKILVEKSMHQSASNSNIKSTFKQEQNGLQVVYDSRGTTLKIFYAPTALKSFQHHTATISSKG